MKEIAVSVQAIDGFEPNILEGLNNFDHIHIDVMDGKFVKSISNNLEIVLIMSVHPGQSSQKFLPQNIDRVNQIAEYKKENNFKMIQMVG